MVKDFEIETIDTIPVASFKIGVDSPRIPTFLTSASYVRSGLIHIDITWAASVYFEYHL